MDLSEVRKLEEKQQLHELAEAIRRGARMKPQCYGAMFSSIGQNFKSCALGAAMDGIGSELNLDRAFPLLESRVVSFPPYINFCSDTLARAIIILNDHCHWSRERIADWIDTL